MTTKNTSVRLTPAEEASLNKIAELSGCLLRNGKPSWRILLQDMAAGTFILFDKRKPKKKKIWGKKKGTKEKIPGAPDWWSPFYGNSMGDQFAKDKSGLDTMGIAALGITPDHRPRLSHPDIWIGLPEWRGKFDPTPKRPHYWWTPEEDNSMVASDAVEVSGHTLDELVAGGLVLDDEEVSLTCPKTWEGWVYGKKDVKQARDNDRTEAPPPNAPNQPLSQEDIDRNQEEERKKHEAMCEQRERDMSHIRDMTGGQK